MCISSKTYLRSCVCLVYEYDKVFSAIEWLTVWKVPPDPCPNSQPHVLEICIVNSSNFSHSNVSFFSCKLLLDFLFVCFKILCEHSLVILNLNPHFYTSPATQFLVSFVLCTDGCSLSPVFHTTLDTRLKVFPSMLDSHTWSAHFDDLSISLRFVFTHHSCLLCLYIVTLFALETLLTIFTHSVFCGRKMKK